VKTDAHFRKWLPAAVFLAFGLLHAGNPGRLTLEPVIVMRADVLDVRAEGTTTLATLTFEIRQEEGGSASAALPWPDGAESSTRLTLNGRGRVGDASHEVDLETVLLLPDGKRLTVRRSLAMTEASTYLVDLQESGDRRLLLALQAESDQRPVVRTAPTATYGPPVRFKLEVVRIAGNSATSLETNRLVTFVGEDVGYSFRRGQAATAESIELSLRPVRLDGNLAEVEIEVSASLPGEPDRLILSRRETLFATRHATSSLTVASGDPASGYRFRVTADF
jgi:hypothetical protein